MLLELQLVSQNLPGRSEYTRVRNTISAYHVGNAYLQVDHFERCCMACPTLWNPAGQYTATFPILPPPNSPPASSPPTRIQHGM